ncbi:MAG: hypothetical protein ACI8X5_002185 [Planctomycetota bacterium]|jgi:hypothetical protein
MTTFPTQRASTLPSGDPTVATLLTLFIPGAGHLYIGRTGFALLAFVIVEGLFLLGLKLSDGMGFEFLQAELRTMLAPALAPEFGNLGGLIYQIRSYGFGLGEPRVFPSTVVLGSSLTAVSGIMNVCVMCHAHFEARLPKYAHSGIKSPALPVLLTWLIPGLGHVFQGRRARGLLVFVTIVGLMVLGTLIADGSNLSRERHYYYWGGQLMGGLPAILMQAVWGAKELTHIIPYAEAGLVIAAVAGLLNIMVMLDVYGWAEGKWFSAHEGDAKEPEAKNGASTEGQTA